MQITYHTLAIHFYLKKPQVLEMIQFRSNYVLHFSVISTLYQIALPPLKKWSTSGSLGSRRCM